MYRLVCCVLNSVTLKKTFEHCRHLIMLINVFSSDGDEEDEEEEEEEEEKEE